MVEIVNFWKLELLSQINRNKGFVQRELKLKWDGGSLNMAGIVRIKVFRAYPNIRKVKVCSS